MVSVILLILLLGLPVSAEATRYWVDPSGSDANACASIDGDADPGVYRATPAGGMSCISGGDTLTVKAGTYTGTTAYFPSIPAGPSANQPTIIEGDPNDPEWCALSSTCGTLLRPTTNRTLITVSHVILRKLRFSHLNNKALGAGPYVDGVGITNVLIEDVESFESRINDPNTTCGAAGGFGSSPQTSFITWRRAHAHDNGNFDPANVCAHGFYVSGDDSVVEYSWSHDNANSGMQCYNGHSTSDGRSDRCTVRYSVFNDNTSGGLLVEGHDSRISHNLIYNNGAGILLGYSGTAGTVVYKNTIYNNSGAGVQFRSGSSNSTAINNVIFGNDLAVQVVSGLTGLVYTHNACSAAQTCTTTGKVTLTNLTTDLVDPANGDFRLKQGANALVDVGTTSAAFPGFVGTAPDIGAYERGTINAATVAGTVIEVTANILFPGALPTTGITGFTITNGTSTGTPVVTAAVIKAGASNIVQLSVSGFTGSGTCTLSYGAGNLTDSGLIGLLAQGLNSVSGLSVSGTCNNTSGGSAPGGLYSQFNLDEGSGTTATDSSGNANHGTVSTGVTWVNDTSGTGVSIPTDATYRHVASTYGQGVNPTSESLSMCALLLPDTQYASKIPISAGGNGTDQRFYAGWTTIGGIKQWTVGVQNKTLSQEASEFPLQAKLTLVCVRANAATDTVTLSVDRTIGTSAGAVKTYTSFTLVDDLRVGNDGTFTNNNGGVTVYGMWVWNNTYISNADVQALYDTIFPAGGSVGCYAQKTHVWQGVRVDGSSNPENLKAIGAINVNVVANGAVALEQQVDCTGSAGAPLALRLWVSDIVGNEVAVPQEVGGFGVGMWGSDPSTSLNSGAVTCCLTGALTPVNGSTILNSVATETIQLAQNSSKVFRWIIHFGTTEKTYFFKLKQDNGAELSAAAGTIPSVTVIAPQASGGF